MYLDLKLFGQVLKSRISELGAIVCHNYLEEPEHLDDLKGDCRQWFGFDPLCKIINGNHTILQSFGCRKEFSNQVNPSYYERHRVIH